ncbi:MAG: aminotransferase class IV, partial [Desulfovermiculus sp.]
MKNNFFEVQSVEACEHILSSFAPVPDIEKVGLEQALSLVTARDIRAEEDLPADSRSSMDGYAVRARDCFGAGESNPVYLSLKAQLAVDESPQMSLNPGECAEILTGGTLPSGADAVVMVEHTRQIAEDEIEVFRSLGPGDNIMLKGEDCKSGEIALGAGKRLRPQDLGVLAALGHSRVDVFRRPRVAILSTGDELVPVEEKPVPGKIRDVNSTTLAAWCSRAGAEPWIMGIVQDQQQDLGCGCDEALLLDTEGYVAEGSGENFFMVSEGVIYTPELTSALDGITRRTIMTLAQECGILVREKRIT